MDDSKPTHGWPGEHRTRSLEGEPPLRSLRLSLICPDLRRAVALTQQLWPGGSTSIAHHVPAKHQFEPRVVTWPFQKLGLGPQDILHAAFSGPEQRGV